MMQDLINLEVGVLTKNIDFSTEVPTFRASMLVLHFDLRLKAGIVKILFKNRWAC